MNRAAGSAHRWWRGLDCLRSATPFDARCMLALIALPTAWKVLSLDFGKLAILCERPALFSFKPNWVYQLLSANSCSLFKVAGPGAYQIVIALLLLATVARPSRFFLLPTVLLLWLLDTSAYMYRATLYTLDTPLALLTILLFMPVRMPVAFSWRREPSEAARLAMFAALSYVAAYYVLAGIAKIDFAWNWPMIVKVGNYYPISYLWHAQELPPLVDGIARRTSETLLAHRSLDVLGSSIVLVEQFVWLAAPFSLLMRVHAGLFSAAYHVVVSLTTGITFITWFFIPLAVTAPFSRIAARLFDREVAEPELAATSDGPGISRGLVAAGVLGAALAAFPSGSWPWPPFHNYFAFGWRYPDPTEIKTIHRLGYIDPHGKAVRSFPLGQGGFLDFRQTAMMDVYVKLALTGTDGQLHEMAGRALRTLLSATVGIGANGWLLGRWSAPAHLLGSPGQMDMRAVKKFYLLKGTPDARVDGRPLSVKWQTCGEIDADGADGARAYILYETCRDTNG